VGEDVAAEEILVIGDTPLDVECARAIGARVVAVATGVHSREELAATSPDLLLDDLSDAAEVWRLLDSRGLRE
jgi:phosphoglycolate phosphatase